MKGCRRNDAPPHIYAVAQQAYRSMISNRRSQAFVFTGGSGSGKTVQMKHFLHYLCLCAGTVNKLLTALNECTEWGQVFILDSLANYQPRDEKEAQR